MEFYQIKDYSEEIFDNFFRRKIYLKLQNKVKNVAYHKPGAGLGDLVLSIPVFRALKKMFPKAKIIFFGSYASSYASLLCDSIFKAIPYIDEFVLDIEPRKKEVFKGFLSFFREYFRKFDLIVSGQIKFLPSLRLWLLFPNFYISRNPLFSRWKVLNFKFYKEREVHVISKMIAPIKVLGLKYVDLSPKIEIPKIYISLCENYLNRFSGPFISIIPSAGDPYKNWPVNRYILLADKLSQMGYKIILIGSEREKDILLEVKNGMTTQPIIPLLEERKFGEDPIYSVGLLKFSLLAIGNDSGGLHLASLAGCPVIGIYGPTSPIKWFPLGMRNIAIYKNFKCSPCTKDELKNCKIEMKCLRDITIEEIVEAVKLILKTT